VNLEPLSPELMPQAAPWFDDEASMRFLGGRGWPALMMRLAERPPAEYRGRAVVGRWAWIGLEDERPIGMVAAERYDDRSAEVSIVVAPPERGRGIGQELVRSALARPELEDLDCVWAGIEPENVASIRCFERVGFVRVTEEPDADDVVYFAYGRPGTKTPHRVPITYA
jgi:RimJ/RimL family protein N-acetyltransferase